MFGRSLQRRYENELPPWLYGKISGNKSTWRNVGLDENSVKEGQIQAEERYFIEICVLTFLSEISGSANIFSMEQMCNTYKPEPKNKRNTIIAPIRSKDAIQKTENGFR